MERPKRFDWVDVVVVASLAAMIYGITIVARQWSSPIQPVAPIELKPSHLPLYMLFSFTRGLIAYVLSFLFTIAYGYAAARVRGAERVLLPALDIFQSIPVLGFLPGLVLGLVYLFPHQNLGLEMASVLMIFTGQVWNMTFSFYASLKSVPEELQAVARISRLTRWQRFLRLDLSHAATGLVWNSMISMAGGWFFLTVSESFVLGSRDFRLPGLGSYMSLAIEQGNVGAQVEGVLAMMTIIVMLDQLVWRPLVAWSDRFSMEESESSRTAASWVYQQILSSHLVRGLGRLRRSVLSWRVRKTKAPARAPTPKPRPEWVALMSAGALKLVKVVVPLAAVLGAIEYVRFLGNLDGGDWRVVLASTGVTFCRVMAAVLLASLWTIPVGVAIGTRPHLTRKLQPLIQIVASFPAPMVYPLVLGLVLAVGGNLAWGSVLLLLLGTQWYVLFNVIAGAAGIPRDLWEVARLGRLSVRLRWQRLILPGIFPALLTGWITATGGAWNATIVAEYLKYKGQILTTTGLGALISEATDRGHFHMLAASVGLMSLVVVSFNRLVWRPLSVLAETRYNLKG